MKLKAFLKKNGEKLMVVSIILGLSISVLTACTSCSKQNLPEPGPEQVTPIVVPIDPVNPVDPIIDPVDPIIDPTDPVIDPTDPVIDPVDPVVNPEDPGTNPEVNPDDPGTNPEVNPGDPGTNPEVNPDDPGTNPEVNPQPTELNFSGLEEKLVEIGDELKWGYKLTELVNYSMAEDGLYIVTDSNYRSNNMVAIYKLEGDFKIETQDDINSLTNTVEAESFVEQIYMIKSKSDVTVNGVTYSKDGIEGDNIFARKCGVENAKMTYVSGLGVQTFSDTNTGYGKHVYILVLTEDNKVVLKCYTAEYYNGYSDQRCYENLFNENTNHLNSEQTIELGKGLGEKPKTAENAGRQLGD